MIQASDFDIEKWKNRFKANSVVLDPMTEKVYDVCKRATTTYRSAKYKYLNVNRLSLEFAAKLEKGYPLILFNKDETFLLEMFRNYPPAEKWQNITCKILLTPLEFCEVLEKWQTSHLQSSTT